MSRTDLFYFPHTGLRAAMFDVAARLARVDLAAGPDADDLFDRMRRTLAFLREHAAHEDSVILPELARHRPEVASAFAGEHRLVQGQEARVEMLLARAEAAPAAARPAFGRRLLAQWHRLVAHHLLHMEREEEEGNRVLQAHCPDARLDELRAAVQSSLSPARRAEWMELILAALPARLRSQLLAAAASGGQS